MTGSPGSRRDHSRFCLNEGWAEVRNTRGKKVRHHLTYELALPNGRILRTRISHPVNSERYGPSLWAHILADQLEVTESEFWACVTDGTLPDRGATIEIPVNALPVQLAHQLVHDAGIPETEVAKMDLARAIEVMNEYWSRPPE